MHRGGVYIIYNVRIMFKNYTCMGSFITNIQIIRVFKIFKGFEVEVDNVQNGIIIPLSAQLNHETPCAIF